jgi:gluconate 2-dehydrogenase gamma chain
MLELTDLQCCTLAAVAERILPSDDGPGAHETGAADYVAAALGEERLRGLLPLFARGFDRIEEISQATLGTGFSEAGPDRQDDVLRQLETLPDPAIRHFLARLVRLCVEGFAGPPASGGATWAIRWTEWKATNAATR